MKTKFIRTVKVASLVIVGYAIRQAELKYQMKKLTPKLQQLARDETSKAFSEGFRAACDDLDVQRSHYWKYKETYLDSPKSD